VDDDKEYGEDPNFDRDKFNREMGLKQFQIKQAVQEQEAKHGDDDYWRNKISGTQPGAGAPTPGTVKAAESAGAGSAVGTKAAGAEAGALAAKTGAKSGTGGDSEPRGGAVKTNNGKNPYGLKQQALGGGGLFTGKSKGHPPKPGRVSRTRNFFKKNALKLTGGLAALLLPIIVLVLLQLGSLIIPNFTEHMLAWQFARVSRQFSNSANEVIATKLQIDRTTAAQLGLADQTLNGLGDNMWGKLTRTFRPKKLVLTMLNNDQLKVNWNAPETVKVKGDLTLVRDSVGSIEVNGKVLQVPQNRSGLLGKIKNPTQWARDWLDYRKFGKDLKAAIPRQFGNGLMVRGAASKIIRDNIAGLELFRWTKDEVKKSATETVDEAAVKETQRSYKVATNSGAAADEAAKGASNEIEDQAKQTAQDTEQCMTDSACTKSMIRKGGGITQKTILRLNSAFSQTWVKQAIGAINPAYEIIVPLCLVYEASIPNSAGTIKANSESAERTYFGVSSAGDAQRYTQQTAGDNRVSANLTGGLVTQMDNVHSNPDIGSLAESNTEKRAAGEPYDTSNTPSAEASAGGTYSYDSVSALLGPFAAGAATVLGPACPIFANPWGGALVGIASLAVGVIPGLGEIAEAGGQITARVVAGAVARQFGQMVAKFFSKKELLKLGIVAGATELAAIAAKMITMQRTGAGTNGTQQGAAYDNVADMGAEIFAQNVDRKQNYARPLTAAELAAVRKLDLAYMKEQRQSENFSERYFAIQNPDSLANHLGMSLYRFANVRSFSSVLNSAARLFNPLTLFSRAFASLSGPRAAADAVAGLPSTDYGIIQWGWSADEEQAYTSGANYALLYDQQQLDASGKTGEIESKYGKCWNSDISDLLANGDIQRSENGDVIEGKGDCSPLSLGMHNPSYGDLVFRYRVAKRNSKALDQMIAIQNVTPDTKQ
jgi:hypothetical protein